jgi:hypothetical protein
MTDPKTPAQRKAEARERVAHRLGLPMGRRIAQIA